MGKILVFAFVLSGFCSFSQSALEAPFNKNHAGKALTVVLEDFEKNYPVRFYFLTEWIEGISLDSSLLGRPLGNVLNEIFEGSDLTYLSLNPYAIVLVKDPTRGIQRKTIIETAVREFKKIEKVQIGSPDGFKLTQRVTLRGVVTETRSKNPMTGVNVHVTDIQQGAVTDINGNYEVTMPVGSHVLSFSYLNFEEKIIDLSIYANGNIKVELDEMPVVLDEVVVQDKALREITTNRMGQTQLIMKEVKRAPALLGEIDLIKQIQVLPGVTTAGEAASGFNVRGGSTDQNLILFDDLPVFNSSHVFGFFSAFNHESIRDVNFYRGGIPAEFGGRVSSVLDIRSKEGDYEKWNGGGGIGIISSNLFASGPIQKDKTSIAVSVRSTYSNWLLKAIKSNYVDLNHSSVFFFDGSVKITHKFDNNRKLTFSGYGSADQFQLQTDTAYSYSNKLASLRYDRQVNDRLGYSLVAGWGSYGYRVSEPDSPTGFDLLYRISYPTIKTNFHLQGNAHKFSFGLHSNYYKFNPGELKPSSSQSSITPVQMEQQQSIESALFFGDEFTVTGKIFLEGGLRLSLFSSLGPATVNKYDPSLPRETYNQTGVETYGKGKIIKTYLGPEPRLSLRYSLNSTSSIKSGYNRVYQYLHLVTNTTAITPVDVWQPSNTFFKPQMADQYSIGYFKNFKNKSYEFFLETYYKTIQNILDFKDGARLILNPDLESDLIQGRGRAYGLETSISKLTGLITGSINYTYSRSLRQISGSTQRESVNGGKEYASNFDQPHIFNFTWKCSLTRRYFFTGIFTYHTGRPVTLPLSGFLVDAIPVSNFSARNDFRIPNYHRLDLAFVAEGNHKRKKILDGTWTVSAYNVYGRKNAYSVFFKDDGNGVIRPYQLSIIGTMLPSISYSFKI